MKRKSRDLRGLPHAPARAAFTMIEMIVAIGIILILLAIGVIGFRALDASASKKETFTTLTSLQSMVAELESTAGLGNLEGPQGVYALKDRIWRNPQTGQVGNPGDVVAGTTNGDRARYDGAVARTQAVIGRLMQVPKNKTAIGLIPSKRLLGSVDNGVPTQTTMVPALGSSKKMPDPPVPLDGWRNPVLFVPSGGLENVNIEGASGNPQRITAPSNRPFWASAGPDGDFTKGDDNIYSFTQQ